MQGSQCTVCAWLLFYFIGDIADVYTAVSMAAYWSRAPPINLNFLNFGLIGGKNDGIQPSKGRNRMAQLERERRKAIKRDGGGRRYDPTTAYIRLAAVQGGKKFL